MYEYIPGRTQPFAKVDIEKLIACLFPIFTSPGGHLPVAVVLVLGFSNIFADALSMGVGEYLSSKVRPSEPCFFFFSCYVLIRLNCGLMLCFVQLIVTGQAVLLLIKLLIMVPTSHAECAYCLLWCTLQVLEICSHANSKCFVPEYGRSVITGCNTSYRP